ncbi:MAG: OmpA family protein [Bacteroidales bacterium]|nr:OmpA family protein [Bacteroidales bacterium]
MRFRGFISVLALLGCIGAYAAPVGHSVSAKIGYSVGKTEVNQEFRRNGKAVSTLDNVLSSGASVSRIEIVSSSSPDGPYSLNRHLAGQRSFYAVMFLKDRYSIPDSLFVVKTVDEDWKGLAAYLRRSDKPWKDEALKIVESGGANRKAQLQDLWVGEAWEDLMKNAFPALRKTEVRVVLAGGGEEQGDDQILFRRGHRQLDLNEGNSATLGEVKKKIEEGYSGTISIAGYASPDGSAAANERLSLARAQSVKDYLVKNLGYPSDRITVSSCEVDWEKLAVTVENSYYGDDKARVLEILRDQNLSSAQKKHSLIVLDGGSTWQSLKYDQMLPLCSATISLGE